MSTPMFVREVMTHRVGTVGPTATLEDMRRLAHRDDLLAVAVVNRQQPIAVLTRQHLDSLEGPDATAAAGLDHTPWLEQPGGQPPIVLAPDQLTAELEAVFHQFGTSVALVVDHHDIIGLVTLGDLTEATQAELAST